MTVSHAQRAQLQSDFPRLFEGPPILRMNAGWLPQLRELCADLQHYLDATTGVPQIVIGAVEERQGAMKVTSVGGDEHTGGVIWAAERHSQLVCCLCGSPVSLRPDRDRGLCDTCAGPASIDFRSLAHEVEDELWSQVDGRPMDGLATDRGASGREGEPPFARMFQLVVSFPSLEAWTGGWEASRFAGWAAHHAHSPPARHAASFVLRVWGPADWSRTVPGAPPVYDHVAAWSTWDQPHRDAAHAWMADPWIR